MSKTIHRLKLQTEYWDALVSGQKSFEVRRDDRGFQRGDLLELYRHDREHRGGVGEWVGTSGDAIFDRQYAATALASIEYVLTGGQLGIEPGYVVMAVRIVKTGRGPLKAE